MGGEPVVKKGATYDDLEALPLYYVGEILDGTLYGHPRPATGHGHAQSVLNYLLFGPFGVGQGGPGGWWFLTEPELHFGEDVLVPDLAGWRRERMPQPPPPQTPHLTVPPDWVCEILSPRTRTHDLQKKLPRYREAGVLFAWTIDPLSRTVEAWVSEEGRWRSGRRAAGSEVAVLPPFDAVALELGLLWT